MREHIGRVIKAELVKRKIRQNELAQRLGVPVKKVNNLLNGKSPLDFLFIIRIINALGLDPVRIYKEAEAIQQQEGSYANQEERN